MKSHLSINVNGHYLSLPEDFSIDVEDLNPIFNDMEMFSYPVEIPLENNRAVVKNVDDINSDLRPVSLEHVPVKIFVDGIPFRSGTAVMQEDEEVADSLSMNVDASTQTFDDLIGDLDCRDVPLKDDILIGEKIGNVKVDVTYTYQAVVDYKGKKHTETYTRAGNKVTGSFEPQALGFSYPAVCFVESSSSQVAAKSLFKTRAYPNGKTLVVPIVVQSFINVDTPYPTKPYCNARVAYKHYGLNDDGSTSDKIVPADESKNAYEDHFPYWVLDADRPQSGICFYVLYFLDCLFSYLGVSFDNSALRAIGDLNRLCFFTTHCKYTTKIIHGSESNFFFKNLDDINKWLSSRGCGGTLEIENPEPKQVNSFTYTFLGETKEIVVGKDDVKSITLKATVTEKSVSSNILAMYASSDNFPEESVKTIINSLENSFGIKFHYDYEKKHVKAYLLRDVFRNQEKPVIFHGEVLSFKKISEKITGVRMKYSAESDSKEQRNNVRYGVRDYDTNFDYIDYPKDRTVTDKKYSDFFKNLSAGDMNVYIDRSTGNAYRIKVDSDATKAAELRPVLFEVGGYKGVEYGDCSTENNDFVKEFVSDFFPVPFNDVNYQNELAMATGEDITDDEGHSLSNFNKDSQPIFSAFIDEDMEHEFVKQRIRNVLSSAWVDLYLTENLELRESYDPSSTDDGNSPLQSYDWGLAIAIMRGGGTDSTFITYDYNYDGFKNSRWRTVAGQYALTSDSIDTQGNEFDYNGTLSGVGDEERFSLKIRAYKQPKWAAEPLCNPDVVDSQTLKIIKKIRSRGLFDTFMSEYAYFLVNRKKYKIRALVSAAQIADIPNHWRNRFSIDGKVGYINRLSYNISANTGIGEVEIEFYTL